MRFDIIIPVIIGGLLIYKANSKGLVARLVQIYILYTSYNLFMKYWGVDLEKALFGLTPLLVLSPMIIRGIFKIIKSIKKRRIEVFEEFEEE